jgi:hypothetical protein
MEAPSGAILDITAAGLGSGETEAIRLALLVSPDRVLLDDGPGRRLARQMGLQIVGVLGLLVIAKENGLISAVRPEIDALFAAGFRMSLSLYRRLLVTCNEK